MWQRFTERARKVVFYAQEEAQKFGEGYVSTEHLLLGLVRESDSVAARVLEKLGVSLNRVRVEVTKLLPRGDAHSSQDMTLTPRAKRVIDLAYDEARNLNNNYIGTEHLLLGLIREGDGLAGRVLAKLGVELERARREVMALQDNEGRLPTGDPNRIAAREPQPSTEPFDWSAFDDAAKGTVLHAEGEREAVADAQVSPLHLFLGLLEQRDSVALRALERLGVTVKRIRNEIERYRVWAGGAPDIRLSPNARKVIDTAYEEARWQGDETVGSEHMLLGLIRGNEKGAGSLLADLGVDTVRLRQEFKAMREEAGTTPNSPSESGAPKLDPVFEQPTPKKGALWQRMTESARGAIFGAQEEALRHGENYISTEHLLLGLLLEPGSLAGRVLGACALDSEKIRAEVETHIIRHDRASVEDLRLTPRGKRVIDLADDEAARMNDEHVGSEHLLLGLLREADGVGGRVLVALGMNLERTRREVVAQREAGTTGQDPQSDETEWSNAHPVEKPEGSS